MKILHVINSLIMEGAERLLTDMASALKDYNHQVDVLVLKDIDSFFKEQLVANNIKIYSLTKNGNIYNPLLLFKVISYLRKYDLVHVHLFPVQYWVAFARFISFSKVKMITTEQNTFNRRRDKWWFKRIDKFVYLQYNHIVCCSDKAYELLTRYIGRYKNIHTIYNGVKVSKIAECSPCPKTKLLGIAEDTALLVMAAGFRPQKDQDTVIRALTRLPENCHLALVGEGTRRAICESLAQELGVEDRVHFMGIRSDIEKILKTADIVILSSYYEGLSLSSIEGMAAGKPFIGSAVNGLVEIVEGAGLLFEVGKEQELADIIIRLMHNREFYDSVAKACYERSLLYDLAPCVDKYVQIYQSLVQKPNGPHDNNSDLKS